jgi:hypothetical protein
MRDAPSAIRSIVVPLLLFIASVPGCDLGAQGGRYVCSGSTTKYDPDTSAYIVEILGFHNWGANAGQAEEELLFRIVFSTRFSEPCLGRQSQRAYDELHTRVVETYNMAGGDVSVVVDWNRESGVVQVNNASFMFVLGSTYNFVVEDGGHVVLP